MVRLAPPLGSAPARSKPVSSQRLVNMYPQKSPEGAASEFWLVGCPGLRKVLDLPTMPVRGEITFGGVLYAVGGDTLYRVAADNTATAMSGSLIPDGPLTMAAGKNQLVLTAGGNGYWINKTNAFLVRITDPDFPGASSVSYLDGYFIFTSPDNDIWFISGLLDAIDFDALDFASAESQPDKLLRVLVTHREVWLFGSETTEIWTDTGAADFPFERYSPAAIDRGLMAALSAANLDNTSFWVGDDGIVYRADGYTPLAVSTPEVSKAIGDCATPADMVGLTWTQEQHVFYALRIPGVGTWVFDAATQEWHERETFGRDIWRVGCYASAYGRHYVGDDTTGGIYLFDFGVQVDGDAPLAWEIITTPLWNEDERFIVSRFQADFEVGVGLTTGQGSDPQAMLQISRDGGYTYGNEQWRSLGKIGERKKRVLWRRQGQFRQPAVAKIRITDAVNRHLAGFTFDAEKCAV